MSHEELRDLLHRVVPEAPEPLPGSLVAAGRRSRTRRRAGVVVGAAVAVALVATTAVVLGGSEPSPRPDTVVSPSPDPTPTTTPATTEPYDANVCPESIPASFDNPRAIDVTDVVAITYCSTLLDGPGPSEPLTPDAFVDDMDVFVAAARDNPMTRSTCLYISYRPAGVVVFEMADGTSTAVFADCDTITLGRARPVTLSMSRVFQDALDVQRDRLDYRARVDASCTGGPAAAPVRPVREDLVDALYCSGDGTLRASLDAAQLSTLRAAWQAATPMSDDEVSRCYANGDAGPYVLTTTDRGDAVPLVTSTCGYLVLDSASLGPLRIDVAPDELGLS